MFTATEALGLVMAVLDGTAVDAMDPVGSALGKVMRVLPESVANAAEIVWKVSARDRDPGARSPDPEITSALVQACDSRRRLSLRYRLGSRGERTMEVDPWAVVVRRGRWYLLCWSHTRDARRVLRVDRVVRVEVLDGTFTPPAALNPVAALEEHLAEGWAYEVEVVVDAPVDTVSRWIPRNLGRCEAIGAERTRLVATTDEPDWYARQLTVIDAPFRIVKPRELAEAADVLGRRLVRACHDSEDAMGE
jgi:predicted DNA-binding transcriptional regulator YafY